MIDIMSFSEEECINYTLLKNQPSYRGKQLYGWLRKGISSFEEIKNLPKTFIDEIKAECFLAICTPVRIQISADGTRKYLFSLTDEETVESVFMKYRHGNTACISTQAGCRMGCTFCASTVGGLKRNLYPSEMLSQITEIQKDTGERISNIVLMGMGEPLDNYDNVIKFLHLVNDSQGLNIGYRHISLSTCGIIENINRLAEEGLPITLSVSLHAPNGEIRKQIMPIAKKYDYDSLLDACKAYADKTKRRISYEYALIAGINDRPEDAYELGNRLKGSLCHINLIPLNKTDRKIYKTSEKSHIESFKNILESYKITVTVRRSLGSDISAACGQLRSQHLNQNGENSGF